MTNIFEKILYGLKVANDNIIVLNEKMDSLLSSLSFEDETAPKDEAGTDTEIGFINN